MSKKLNIVSISDINYIQHFTVAITSLLENNRLIIENIYLIHDVDNIEVLSTMLIFFKVHYNFDIKLLKVNKEKFLELKISHHLTIATYYRLAIVDLMPKNVEEVLYIDTDVIVNGDLSEFLLKDFKDSKNNLFSLYAVDHKHQNDELQRLSDFDINHLRYFNAGVLHINLKIWREKSISTVFEKIINNYKDKLLWADQDILNIAFNNEWKELDFKYNAFGLDSYEKNHDYKIIHYTGPSKPWHFRNNHPYKHLYWKYLKMTPFKRHIPEDLTILNFIKWIIPLKVKKIIHKILT